MAIIFHGSVSLNGSGGNWLALPALPAGTDPMRRVIVAGYEPFYVGQCTPGQATADAGAFYVGDTGQLCRMDFGVVDYTKLTARDVGGTGNPIWIISYSSTDMGPEGS
jgi:hypothetical protein